MTWETKIPDYPEAQRKWLKTLAESIPGEVLEQCCRLARANVKHMLERQRKPDLYGPPNYGFGIQPEDFAGPLVDEPQEPYRPKLAGKGLLRGVMVKGKR